MNREELEKKYSDLLADNDLFLAKNIIDINHKPHLFMIGAKHIEAAGKFIDEHVCRKVGCAHPGCNIPYDKHTHDTVLCLQLKRNGTQEEANAALMPLGAILTEDKIDGLLFIETPEKFRIAQPND